MRGGWFHGWIAATAAALLLLLWFAVAGCGEDAGQEADSEAYETGGSTTTTAETDAGSEAADSEAGDTDMTEGNAKVRLQTNRGDIVIALYSEEAPVSSENFLSYVRDGFYDGTIFHRVIPGFMVQGGGFTPDMSQKPTKNPIENEATNGLKNERGTLAMARTMNVHSATAQFFVNLVDNDFLDHREETPQGFGYAVFGRVVEGMDVVDEIASVETTTKAPHQDVPVEDIVIERAEVVE